MEEKTLAKIRKFTFEDIDKILEIEAQAFPKTAYSRGTLLGYAKSSHTRFIVVETDTDIVGYMIFDIGGHIHSTAVKSFYRRKGFGKMMFTHALNHVKKGLWLEVRSQNIGAIHFYRAVGMSITGRIPDYYRNDDALVMALSREYGIRSSSVNHEDRGSG